MVSFVGSFLSSLSIDSLRTGGFPFASKYRVGDEFNAAILKSAQLKDSPPQKWAPPEKHIQVLYRQTLTQFPSPAGTKLSLCSRPTRPTPEPLQRGKKTAKEEIGRHQLSRCLQWSTPVLGPETHLRMWKWCGKMCVCVSTEKENCCAHIRPRKRGDCHQGMDPQSGCSWIAPSPSHHKSQVALKKRAVVITNKSCPFLSRTCRHLVIWRKHVCP